MKVHETVLNCEYLRNGNTYKAILKSPGLTVFLTNGRRVALMNDMDIEPKPAEQPAQPEPENQTQQEPVQPQPETQPQEPTTATEGNKPKAGEETNVKIRKYGAAGNKKKSRAANR